MVSLAASSNSEPKQAGSLAPRPPRMHEIKSVQVACHLATQPSTRLHPPTTPHPLTWAVTLRVCVCVQCYGVVFFLSERVVAKISALNPFANANETNGSADPSQQSRQRPANGCQHDRQQDP